jgi:hypothetical protein
MNSSYIRTLQSTLYSCMEMSQCSHLYNQYMLIKERARRTWKKKQTTRNRLRKCGNLQVHVNKQKKRKAKMATRLSKLFLCLNSTSAFICPLSYPLLALRIWRLGVIVAPQFRLTFFFSLLFLVEVDSFSTPECVQLPKLCKCIFKDICTLLYMIFISKADCKQILNPT